MVSGNVLLGAEFDSPRLILGWDHRLGQATNVACTLGPSRPRKTRFWSRLLGGAAVYRCDKRPIFSAGFSPEGSTRQATESFRSLFSR